MGVAYGTSSGVVDVGKSMFLPFEYEKGIKVNSNTMEELSSGRRLVDSDIIEVRGDLVADRATIRILSGTMFPEIEEGAPFAKYYDIEMGEGAQSEMFTVDYASPWMLGQPQVELHFAPKVIITQRFGLDY